MSTENPFEKYQIYIRDDSGKSVGVNAEAYSLADEAFDLFKSLYDTHYGSIEEDGNLVEIHTGGWSDNEELIRQFEGTAWWVLNHKATFSGGHYYFDTDFQSDRKWEIVKRVPEKKRKIKDCVLSEPSTSCCFMVDGNCLGNHETRKSCKRNSRF